MSGFQAIKRQLLPLIKGSPVIVAFFFGALYIAKQVVKYTPNTYQTIARIKLDNQKYGFSNNALYTDFDIFSTETKIQAEAVLLNSPLLIGMALDSVDFSVKIYRKGSVKTTMLYDDSPIIISYDFVNNDLFDKDYYIRITEQNTFLLVNEEGEPLPFPETPIGEGLLLDGGILKIDKNLPLLASRDVQVAGEYLVHIFSKDGLIADVSSRLDIVEVDKELPIIRVAYKDQHPVKTADLANALCKTYISDYVTTKTKAAEETVEFIDRKLADVLAELQKAEIALEQYKAKNGVVNTRQETETGLRQISSMEIQLMNLEMNEKAVLELEEYISSGDYFNERSINFGFGDLLMTELVKKLKLWQDERIDLLVKYTPESSEVKAVDQKIEELKNYIVEAIKRNKAEIMTKKREIKNSLEVVSRQFDGLSTKEKELRILERDFHIQEQVYNFLSQKKIEASIAASANIAFHRIIQKATPPTKPVSPNRTLITFVAGLFGIILAITFIYLVKYARAKVSGRPDIERHSDLPLLGLIRKGNSDTDFLGIAKTLQLKGFLEKGKLIAISSTINGEGKTYVANHLAECLAQNNMRIAVVSMNAFATNNSTELNDFLSSANVTNESLTYLHINSADDMNLKAKLISLKPLFDLVIIDTIASGIAIDGIEAMKSADMSLYVIRANTTSIDYLSHADRLVEEYQLDNVMLLLNNAHKAANFSGNFVGTRFMYHKVPGTFKLKIKTYINTYLR